MREVTVETSELLQILQENKAEHEDFYKDALMGWRVTVIEVLKDTIESLESGSDKAVRVNHHPPVSHSGEYEMNIRMLEMSTSEHVTLSEVEFSSLVMDMWDWTSSFVTSSNAYMSDSGKRRLLGKFGNQVI